MKRFIEISPEVHEKIFTHHKKHILQMDTKQYEGKTQDATGSYDPNYLDQSIKQAAETRDANQCVSQSTKDGDVEAPVTTEAPAPVEAPVVTETPVPVETPVTTEAPKETTPVAPVEQVPHAAI